MIKIDYSLEVEQAIKNNDPIVALESTIITHGMPWPENLKTAKSVESIVREYGATPATIAVINGIINVGLEDKTLTELSTKRDVRKLSRADLAHSLVKKETGATTVAATMIIANLAGIKIFATGGIGGVHKFAEKTFDISADLQELAKQIFQWSVLDLRQFLELP